jgi:WD40 repeat protein
VQVWDAASGKQLREIDCGRGHRTSTGFFVLSPDGRTLYSPREKEKATPFQRDGQRLIRWDFEGSAIYAWDLETGTVRDTYKHDPARNMILMKLAPDSKSFLSMEELPGEFPRRPTRVVSLWDVRTKRARPLPEGLSIYGAFSPDSRRLAAVEHDEAGYATAVKLFDLKTTKEVWSTPIAEPAAFGGPSWFTRDGRTLIGYVRAFPKRKDYSTWSERIVLWDAETGKELASIPAPEAKVGLAPQLSPDGKTIVCYTYGDKVNNRLLFIDPVERKVVRTVKVVDSPGGDAGINMWGVCFRPDGRFVSAITIVAPNAAKRRDLTEDDPPQPRIHLIDVAAGTVVETLIAPRGGGFCAQFSPDGKKLATGGVGKVYLWDVSR